MTNLQKRSIPLIILLFFTTACTSTAPVHEPSQTPKSTLPPTKIIEISTATTPATSTASETTEPTSEPTLAPSPTTPPLGGSSGVILFASNRAGVYDDLYLLDISSGEVTRLTSGDSNTFPGPFSPDGSQLLFTGFGLTHSYIGVMHVDGSEPVDLSQSPDSDEGFPTWSPDGQQIAFTSRRDGNNEIYVIPSPSAQAQVQVDGSNPTRLTFNEGDDFAPAWSPDGTQIAFVSDRDNELGVYNLYIMSADGSGVRRLTNGSEIDYAPTWSPDGQRIAYRCHKDGAGEIYVINADGSNPINLTNHPAEDWSPAWSPDGKLIAFQTNRDGNWEIYVIPAPSTQAQVYADGSEPQNLTLDPADDEMPYWKP